MAYTMAAAMSQSLREMNLTGIYGPAQPCFSHVLLESEAVNRKLTEREATDLVIDYLNTAVGSRYREWVRGWTVNEILSALDSIQVLPDVSEHELEHARKIRNARLTLPDTPQSNDRPSSQQGRYVAPARPLTSYSPSYTSRHITWSSSSMRHN